MTITVPKIGTGVEGDFIRPDVPDGTNWQKVEERENEFVIEILEE